ncbi:hypothetical protein HDU97_006263 [Phlyctochytrium planicorne]|nr:hypothetical protein HDU97_006263 [Phlyctochytrium planicorne]
MLRAFRASTTPSAANSTTDLKIVPVFCEKKKKSAPRRLPPELLHNIFPGHGLTRLDILNATLVCKEWHAELHHLICREIVFAGEDRPQVNQFPYLSFDYPEPHYESWEKTKPDKRRRKKERRVLKKLHMERIMSIVKWVQSLQIFATDFEDVLRTLVKGTKGLKYLTDLEIVMCSDLDAQSMEPIERGLVPGGYLQNITAFSLYHNAIRDVPREKLAALRFPKLTTFLTTDNLDSHDKTDEWIKEIVRAHPNLKRLGMPIPNDEEDVAMIKSLKHLRHLLFFGSANPTNDVHLRMAKFALEGTDLLSFYIMYWWIEAKLSFGEILRLCPNLEEAYIEGSLHTVMHGQVSCPLKALAYGSDAIQPLDMVMSQICGTLRMLIIPNCPRLPNHLTSCTNLKVLKAWNAEIDDPELNLLIQHCPLMEVFITGTKCKITGETMKSFSKWKHLRRLSVCLIKEWKGIKYFPLWRILFSVADVKYLLSNSSCQRFELLQTDSKNILQTPYERSLVSRVLALGDLFPERVFAEPVPRSNALDTDQMFEHLRLSPAYDTTKMRCTD